MGLNTRPSPAQHTHAQIFASTPTIIALAGAAASDSDGRLELSGGSSTPLYNEDRGWSSGSGQHGCLLLRSLLLPHQARPSPPGPQQPPKLSSPSAPFCYPVSSASITLCRRRRRRLAVGESPPPTSLRVRVGRPVQGLRGKY